MSGNSFNNARQGEFFPLRLCFHYEAVRVGDASRRIYEY